MAPDECVSPPNRLRNHDRPRIRLDKPGGVNWELEYSSRTKMVPQRDRITLSHDRTHRILNRLLIVRVKLLDRVLCLAPLGIDQENYNQAHHRHNQ